MKNALCNGGVLLGTMVFSFRSPAMVPVCEAAGADFVILDQEATSLSLESLEVMIAAGRGLPTATIVRVPSLRPDYISRALDIGATGIMVPAVDDVEQARNAVSMAKYPPMGSRGVMSGLAGSSYRPDPSIGETLERANRETVVIAQIESVAGVENVDAIAAVDGIDILWVGSLDLSVSIGAPGQFRSTAFVAAVERLVEAAQRAGKVAAAKVSTVDDGQWWLDRGYRCIAFCDDVRLLRDGLTVGINALRTRVAAGTPS